MAKHPYCRTCGSRINSGNVCPYCGCEPLKGNSYCCDCGSGTLPHAIMCIHCGATFQRKFPAVLAALLFTALIVAVGGTLYYFFENRQYQEQVSDTGIHKDTSASSIHTTPYKINDIPDRIINNNIFPGEQSTKNLVRKMTKKMIAPQQKIITVKMPRPKPVERAEQEQNLIPTGKTSINSFSGSELRNYPVICSYSLGRSKSSVVFFTTSVFGYLKMNGRTYELQGVEKGSDIARFSGPIYDVSIEIEGLAGNSSLWLASCTMIVKDKARRSYSRQTVYSSCTEF